MGHGYPQQLSFWRMKTTVDATIGTIPVRQFMAKFPVQMPGSYRTSRMVQICLKKRIIQGSYQKGVAKNEEFTQKLTNFNVSQSSFILRSLSHRGLGLNSKNIYVWVFHNSKRTQHFRFGSTVFVARFYAIISLERRHKYVILNCEVRKI